MKDLRASLSKGNAEPWKVLEHGSEQIRAVLSGDGSCYSVQNGLAGETRGWEDNFESIARK